MRRLFSGFIPPRRESHPDGWSTSAGPTLTAAPFGLRTGLLIGTLGGLLAACSSPDVSSPPTLDQGATFWALTLQSHAITMSMAVPYDTLQLVATPRSALGTPLMGAPAPTFFTTDSSVRVSPTGLLTARAVRSNVKVVAELTYRGVHLADTAVITVTDPAVAPPRPAAQLVLQPEMPGDTTLPVPSQFSDFYGATGAKALDVEVRDASGNVIPEALLALSTSAPPGVATFPGSPVTTSGPVEVDFERYIVRTGVVRVAASATVYGVTVTDTLALTLTAPRLIIINVMAQAGAGSTPGSTPAVYTAVPAGTVTIGVGGSIWWVNRSTLGDALDVVFDDPSAAAADGVFDSGGGDIEPLVGCNGFPFDCDNWRARSFPQAGTFPWHSPKLGIQGTVVVQ